MCIMGVRLGMTKTQLRGSLGQSLAGVHLRTFGPVASLPSDHRLKERPEAFAQRAERTTLSIQYASLYTGKDSRMEGLEDIEEDS